ncbi:MAG: hypothetical protein ACYDCO_07025 [Armatimonadota bacterium]
MKKDIRQERRRYLRVRYPDDAYPSLRIGERLLHVVEISHRGMVVLAEGSLAPNQAVGGALQFRDGHSEQVVGRVLRLSDERTVVYLLHSLPPYRILLERQLLAQCMLARYEPHVERRRSARVRYARGDCPYLIVGKKTFPITEVAEHGLVYRDQYNRFHVHQPIKGILLLQDGAMMNVEGKVLRVTDGRTVLFVPDGLPTERITGRRLVRNRPRLLERLTAERRRSPRVRYPEGQGALLQIDGKQYPVAEISVNGMVLRTGDPGFSEGMPVQAMLIYPAGNRFLVRGAVLRRTEHRVVIRLEVDLPETWVKVELVRHGEPEDTALEPALVTNGIVTVDLRSLRQ